MKYNINLNGAKITQTSQSIDGLQSVVVDGIYSRIGDSEDAHISGDIISIIDNKGRAHDYSHFPIPLSLIIDDNEVEAIHSVAEEDNVAESEKSPNEYFIIEVNDADELESDWMDLGGVSRIFVEPSEVYGGEKATVDGYVFLMEGNNGELYDHSDIPVPVKTTVEMDKITPIYAHSHDDVIEYVTTQKRIEELEKEVESIVQFDTPKDRMDVLFEPMTATKVEYYEDVRKFAKEYNDMTFKEKNQVSALIEMDAYESPLSVDTLQTVMFDVDEYQRYSNQRRYLSKEIDRVIESKYMDQDISSMKHEYEIAGREMKRIDEQYGLTKPMPEITRPNVDVPEDRQEDVAALNRTYGELTDDNYDKFIAELEIFADPGVRIEHPDDMVLSDDDIMLIFQDEGRYL